MSKKEANERYWEKKRISSNLYAKISDLPGEVWYDIPNYESLYQISNKFRVKSLLRHNGVRYIRERILSLYENKNMGYITVTLCDGKVKGRPITLHRIIAQVFISNPDNKPEVNHINGIKTDNRLENLEWTTYSENLIHSYRVLNSHKLKPIIQMDLNGNVINTFESITDAAIYTGLTTTQICAVARGIKGLKTSGGYRWKYL